MRCNYCYIGLRTTNPFSVLYYISPNHSKNPVTLRRCNSECNETMRLPPSPFHLPYLHIYKFFPFHSFPSASMPWPACMEAFTCICITILITSAIFLTTYQCINVILQLLFTPILLIVSKTCNVIRKFQYVACDPFFFCCISTVRYALVGPIDICGTPLKIYLQFETSPSTTTLCLMSVSHCSIQFTTLITIQWDLNLMRYFVKCFLESKMITSNGDLSSPHLLISSKKIIKCVKHDLSFKNPYR